MSTASPADDAHIPPSVPRLLAVPFPRRWWQRGLIFLTIAALFAAIGYVAATEYPDGAPPSGTELESSIAHVFGVPRDGIDNRIIGDLLGSCGTLASGYVRAGALSSRNVLRCGRP